MFSYFFFSTCIPQWWIQFAQSQYWSLPDLLKFHASCCVHQVSKRTVYLNGKRHRLIFVLHWKQTGGIYYISLCRVWSENNSLPSFSWLICYTVADLYYLHFVIIFKHTVTAWKDDFMRFYAMETTLQYTYCKQIFFKFQIHTFKSFFLFTKEEWNAKNIRFIKICTFELFSSVFI